MSLNEDRQAFALVRSYSYEVEQRLSESRHTSSEHTLAHALVREQANLEILAEPWRALFGSTDFESRNDPVNEVMTKSAKQLQDIWRDYQNNSKRGDRLDLDNVDPTPEGITRLISNALTARGEQGRQGGWARAKSRFHRVCGGLDSHKSLLNMLPQSSEYVSIFAGSITAIIQASVTHEGMAEDIAEALCKIDEITTDCHNDLHLFSTDEMRRRVAELYSAIFQYLGSVSRWLTQKKLKRFGSSFNENLRDSYKGELENIKDKADRIKAYTAQGTQKAVKIGFETSFEQFGVLRQQMARIEQTHAQGLMHLGDVLNQLLKGQSTQYLDEQQAVIRDARRIISRSISPSIFSVEDVTNDKIILQELLDSSQALQAYYERDRFRLQFVGAEASLIPPDIVLGLSEWLKASSSTSSLLWLSADQATFSQDQENPMSMIAAKLIDIVAGVNLPGVGKLYFASYFCRLQRRESLREGNPSKEAQVAVALLYAIIAQLFDIMRQISASDPGVRFEDALRLTPEDILELDGSLKTWDRGMEVLEAVAKVMPSGTLCVIDALHWLDSRGTEAQLRRLVGVLRSSTLKVLFTTSGRCAALAKEMTRGEIRSVACDSF